MRAPAGLRDEMRRIRRALTPPEGIARATAAAANLGRLLPSLSMPHGAAVAIYRPTDGELDPGPIAPLIEALDGRMLLPVCVGSGLRFADFDGSTPTERNRYGIEEPVGVPAVDASALDLVIVPLVAFDRCGHRLGMGAGYYDRTFATSAEGDGARRALLVGFGHDEQEVGRLEPDEWDVTMDAIVTPTRAWSTIDD